MAATAEFSAARSTRPEPHVDQVQRRPQRQRVHLSSRISRSRTRRTTARPALAAAQHPGHAHSYSDFESTNSCTGPCNCLLSIESPDRRRPVCGARLLLLRHRAAAGPVTNERYVLLVTDDAPDGCCTDAAPLPATHSASHGPHQSGRHDRGRSPWAPSHVLPPAFGASTERHSVALLQSRDTSTISPAQISKRSWRRLLSQPAASRSRHHRPPSHLRSSPRTPPSPRQRNDRNGWFYSAATTARARVSSYTGTLCNEYLRPPSKRVALRLQIYRRLPLAAPRRKSLTRTSSPERGFQVGDQVVDVLDADREADEAVGDAERARGARAGSRRGS